MVLRFSLLMIMVKDWRWCGDGDSGRGRKGQSTCFCWCETECNVEESKNWEARERSMGDGTLFFLLWKNTTDADCPPCRNILSVPALCLTLPYDPCQYWVDRHIQRCYSVGRVVISSCCCRRRSTRLRRSPVSASPRAPFLTMLRLILIVVSFAVSVLLLYHC